MSWARSRGRRIWLSAALALLLTPAATEAGGGPTQSLTIVSGNSQEAVVTQPFAEPLVVRVTDAATTAPVENAIVTFTTPKGQASATFAGGTDEGHQFEATTNAEGVATSSVLTANTRADRWQATASTPQAPSVQFFMENRAAAPTAISLRLSPSVLDTNERSVSRARATVTDAFGNGVRGQTVAFSASGGQGVSETREENPGRYEARIRSTRTPGDYTVQAQVAGSDPPLSATATLKQRRDVSPPSVLLTDGPANRTKRKRVRFEFQAGTSDVARFQCKLDRQRWRKCSSPKKYKVKLGAHRFKVRAVDAAGNRSEPEADRFKRVKRG